MLGTNLVKLSLAGIVLNVIGLALLAQNAMAQVVIVPSRQLTSTASAKPRAKTKKKPRLEREQLGDQTAEIIPVPEPVEPSATMSNLSFAITMPVLKKAEPAPVAKPKAWPELLGYEFDVINVDDKGRLGEKRKERARFFVEDLGGGVNLEMIEIHAGTFMMGNSPIDLGEIETNYARSLNKESRTELHERLAAELPQQTVKVSGFYMSKFEVTQAQWRAVAALPKVNRDLISDPSGFKGGNRPVEQITWEDAMEFCERLSRATGRHYRLPTESEWEYACRAGTTFQFNLGGTIDPDWVNYNGKLPYAAAPKDLFRQQTVPVGSLGIANAFGLYDMHGNVWEWCLDSWHEAQTEPSSDAKDANKQIREDGTSLRTLRGGAWNSPAGECRSSARKQIPSSMSSNDIGFRVLIEAEIPTPTNK
ncbi:MAG: formylglycine-generating enzyme family protein [Acidobacteria bacterium]|nr:formylglycine-generating enzyme family protein [Acidobacteriota bacterium]